MSNQGSSNQEVSLQADVGHLPNNTVAVLGALSPFVQAITADNVNPLAVIQVEALGACFHLNGELAEKTPDLLRRTTSYRLERLTHSVGWRGNDTASHMAKTAGGRAASVLSLAIVEVYHEEAAGDLFYRLSKKLLPAGANQSSKTQIGQVARTLSNILGAFGFGSHLALHVTRIREAYFNSGIQVPPYLLQIPTVETMTEFLYSLSRALQEEHSVLYFQGCEGVGYTLAIAMALCPDDVFVTVENEVIFQEARRSVIFDIQSALPSQFSIESILYTSGKSSNTPHIVSVHSTEPIFGMQMSLKWDGCLSDALDLALANVCTGFANQVRISCIEVISAIIFSTTPTDMCPSYYDNPLPSTGFMSLLGPEGRTRVRKTLKQIFHCEPSFTVVQFNKAYDDLRISLGNAVPPTSCNCNQCFKDGCLSNAWTKIANGSRSCDVVGVWEAVDWVITR